MSLYLISAYEAGGAEVVSSWLRHQKGITPWFLVEGPAAAVFRRKFGDVAMRTREETFSDHSRFEKVVTSTGIGPAAELAAEVTERSRKAGVPVCAYLDHWVNYTERFLVNGRTVLPDELWVGDRAAETLAKAIFPGTPIRLEPNRYFSDMAEEIASIPAPARSGAHRILYVSDTANRELLGYDEFEALEMYLRYVEGLDTVVEGVRVRLHPNEPEEKYAKLIAEFSRHFPVSETGAQRASLAEDIAWADWVVGCNTMALVIGICAGKKVFSCIPPGGKPMTLPYPEIERIFAR